MHNVTKPFHRSPGIDLDAEGATFANSGKHNYGCCLIANSSWKVQMWEHQEEQKVSQKYINSKQQDKSGCEVRQQEKSVRFSESADY